MVEMREKEASSVATYGRLFHRRVFARFSQNMAALRVMSGNGDDEKPEIDTIDCLWNVRDFGEKRLSGTAG